MPVALVTGASRGIGKAISIRLAEEGMDLCVVARDSSTLDSLASRLAREGVRAVAVSADLSETKAPESVFEAFRSSFDRLDVLVNNAGTAVAKPFGEYSQAEWDYVMNLNARAPFFLTQSMLPMLTEANPGFVVNIGSIVSKKGYADQSLYSASKHALLGFTKALAREVGEAVRVHAVLPGGVNTDLLTDVRPDIDSGELIDPYEIAGIVVSLLRMRGNAVIDEIEVRRRSKEPWG